LKYYTKNSHTFPFPVKYAPCHKKKFQVKGYSDSRVLNIIVFSVLYDREISWLIGKHSPLSLETKLLIYKTVPKPVWIYGIELWGCATNSNIAIIQQYQSKLLRTMTNAPWYVSNHTLHSDLHIPHVRAVFQKWIATPGTTIAPHPNPLTEPLLHRPNTGRLKRRRTFDGIQ
jgi:hypothetical protein